MSDDIIKKIQTKEFRLSFSSLNAFRKSPANFIRYATRETKPTPAMIFGQAMHAFVLEPNEFYKQYAVAPECDRRTKDGKVEYGLFIENSAGKEIISAEDLKKIEFLKESLTNDYIANEILFAYETETEKIVEGEIEGWKFSGRIDVVGSGYKVDLKKTTDANPYKVSNEIDWRNIDMQAAIYQLLCPYYDDSYYIAAVDDGGDISVHELSSSCIERGKQKLFDTLSALERCSLIDGFKQSYGFFAPGNFGIYIKD